MSARLRWLHMQGYAAVQVRWKTGEEVERRVRQEESYLAISPVAGAIVYAVEERTRDQRQIRYYPEAL